MLTIKAYDNESCGAEGAIREAITFVDKNDCQLEMNVLGIRMRIRPGDLLEDLIHQYHHLAVKEYNDIA